MFWSKFEWKTGRDSWQRSRVTECVAAHPASGWQMSVKARLWGENRADRLQDRARDSEARRLQDLRQSGSRSRRRPAGLLGVGGRHAVDGLAVTSPR